MTTEAEEHENKVTAKIDGWVDDIKKYHDRSTIATIFMVGFVILAIIANHKDDHIFSGVFNLLAFAFFIFDVHNDKKATKLVGKLIGYRDAMDEVIAIQNMHPNSRVIFTKRVEDKEEPKE